MKTGIITFQDQINFGAVLQAYALKETVISLGFDCELINYKMKQDNTKKRIRSFHDFKMAVRRIVSKKNVDARKAKFNEFGVKFLNIDVASPIYKNDLSKIDPQYDKFICGSDQVWNYKLTKADYSFLLDFVSDHSKKISYAPSFGLDSIEDKYIDDYKKLLADFSCVSVRELQGQKIVKDLIGLDVPVVLDPTLLLPVEKWDLLDTGKKPNKPYILTYEMSFNSKMVDYARKMAAKENCELIRINAPYHSVAPLFTKEKMVRNGGPIDFITLFKNAKFVATSSFHGTCFSIIFNKPFYCFENELNAGQNSRIHTLLSSLSLSKRIYSGDSAQEEINWDTVNKKLSESKELSIDYLKNALQKNNQ